MGFLKELIHKDMQVNHPKIKQMFEKEDEWFEYLLTLTDKQLERKLNIINLQMPMALEQEKFVELDALYLFKMLVIEARYKKMERGDEEEDEKPKRKRKPKTEKKNEITSTVEPESQTTEEDPNKQEKTSTHKQLSLFNFDNE